MKILSMISLLLASAFAANAAFEPNATTADLLAGTVLTTEQKDSIVRPLVTAATECIVRAVVNDRRYALTSGIAMNDMIVDSMPTCADELRAMIDKYDRLYGSGAGETFFVGPYLDGLPAAVQIRLKAMPGPSS